MGRAISVKVPKAKVVTALKTRLETSSANSVLNEKIRDENKKALEAWQTKLVADFAQHLTLESCSFRSWNSTLEVSYKISDRASLPEQPDEVPCEKVLSQWEVEEIENAIRILEMSDEEFVSAQTMKQIASYL